MSADTPVENGEETTRDDEGPSFGVRAIRNRLPNNLTDTQERMLICAVRNPDAQFQDIADATGTNHSSVISSLESLARGIIGKGHHTNSEWVAQRDGVRPAETFDELTEKQKAVVDFLARHPSFDYREHTARELDAAMRDENPDAPVMSTAYTKQAAQKYDHLVDGRRNQLRAMGEELDADTDDVEPFHPDTPREFLEAAGITELPDENLDSLDDVPDAVEPDEPDESAGPTTDAERLEAAFRRASESGAGISVDVNTFENHVGEGRDEFDDDDVEIGRGYQGVVNGKVDWGVWVTIGGDPEVPNDVSGIVPKEALARAGWSVDDYKTGENIRVVAVGKSNVGDGKTRHRFEIPTADRLPPTETATVPERRENDEEPTSDDSPPTEGDTPRTVGKVAQAATGDDTEFVKVPVDSFLELLERLDSVERDVSRVESQAEENAEAVPDPETAKDLNDAAETVLQAHSELQTLNDRIDDLEDRVNYVEALENDVDNMGDRLAEAIESLDELDGDIDVVLEQLSEVQSDVADHGDKIAAQTAIAENHRDRLEGLDADVEALSETVTYGDDTQSGSTETTIADAIATLDEAGVEYQITATNTSEESE